MRARLLESRELALEVRHFVFELPEVERFEFVPGQFLSFVAEIGDNPITRAYSLAAPPNANRFELCLNRVREGRFSPYLFDLAAGAEVQMTGPYGMFVLRRPVNDSVFVATGTGIAPIRAILLHHLPRELDHRFTLIFGVRYERGILYSAEFEAMARDYPNFRFWPTLSRPEPEWTGRTGHVQQHLFDAAGSRRDLDFYICGLKAMVDDVRALLKTSGFDRRRLVYEKYD